MRFNLAICCSLFISILSFVKIVKGQAKHGVYTGEAFGIARDSVHNYALPLASVSIYRLSDSSLVSYQLTNNFGEFRFKELPINEGLKIILSYVGYNIVSRKFKISDKNRVCDLQDLNMFKSSNILEEVVVKYTPPVRMNGDTLEFNAAAFNLDKNAVAEDLLRKLPRVTVWADGTITVNGKEIKQLLVNGKPFFGGDSRIALQNIPKSAIDKIQVYREQPDLRNPQDSTTTLNVKLQKDKSSGLFGRLLAGYGTTGRYESDIAANLFNKKTQISAVVATNNVNKVPVDVNTIIRNSTFKGVGANIDYQPDFRLSGLNQSTAHGFFFQHDFIENPEINKQSRIKGNYFYKVNENVVSDISQTLTALQSDSTQIRRSDNLSDDNSTSQTATIDYQRRKIDFELNSSLSLNKVKRELQTNTQSSLYNTNGFLLSNSITKNSSWTNSRYLSAEVNLNREKDIRRSDNAPGNWIVNYQFKTGASQAQQEFSSAFRSLNNSIENRDFNRQYTRHDSDVSHQLSLSLGEFSPLLFGKRGIWGLSFIIKNDVALTQHSENRLVKNKDSNDIYRIDSYLTNSNNVTGLNERPAVLIRKIFLRDLANRYQKLFDISANVQQQFFFQNSVSERSFQNFKKSYGNFAPALSFNYLNDEYGEFTDNYTLSYSTEIDYPSLDQLYPIVDSANQYDIRQGNPFLREQVSRKLTFKIDHTSLRMRNAFNYSINIFAGIVSNSFADSAIIDRIGRSTFYPVNLNDKRYLSASLTVNKALKKGMNQVQFQIIPSLNLSRTPGYVNGLANIYHVLSTDNQVSIQYTLNDWWAVNIKESLSIYNSKQSGASNNNFHNTSNSTMFSTSLNMTKRLNLGSNISYNNSTSTGSTAVKFTIWNVNASYRLLKGNNLEFKFSALDLLHQNKGIINSGQNNMITFTKVNVLQQYFMFSAAYHLKKFGFKKTNHSSE